MQAIITSIIITITTTTRPLMSITQEAFPTPRQPTPRHPRHVIDAVVPRLARTGLRLWRARAFGYVASYARASAQHASSHSADERVVETAQPVSPRQASRPSRTATAAMTSAARGSAQDQP
jgi:hypothetical protein